jgi:hypothetical protein
MKKLIAALVILVVGCAASTQPPRETSKSMQEFHCKINVCQSQISRCIMTTGCEEALRCIEDCIEKNVLPEHRDECMSACGYKYPVGFFVATNTCICFMQCEHF